MDDSSSRRHRPGDCGCAECRAGRAWWRDPPRRRAQIAAQNRFVDDAVESVLAELEAEAAEAAGAVPCNAPRLDHCIRWDRDKTLAQLRADATNRYRDPKRQWVYRLRAQGDERPLYVGKTGPAQGGLLARLATHLPGTVATPSLTTAQRLQAVSRAATPHRGGRLVRRGAGRTAKDTAILNDIVRTIGPGNIRIDVGEVCRIDPRQPGVCLPAQRGANLLLERVALFSGRARINRPDRAEDEIAEAAVADLEDLTLDVEAWS